MHAISELLLLADLAANQLECCDLLDRRANRAHCEAARNLRTAVENVKALLAAKEAA